MPMKYDDILIIRAKYPSESLFEFFEHIRDVMLDEMDFCYWYSMGQWDGDEESFAEVAFKRKKVYYRNFRMIMTTDTGDMYDNFWERCTCPNPKLIYYENREGKDFSDLETEMRNWLCKLKAETDSLKLDPMQ